MNHKPGIGIGMKVQVGIGMEKSEPMIFSEGYLTKMRLHYSKFTSQLKNDCMKYWVTIFR